MTDKPETSARLKTAVDSVPVPPYLEARIRARIRGTHPQRLWRLRFAPVAAVLAACIGGSIAYQLGHLRVTAGSQESYIVSVSSRVASLMRVGLGDHIHCSVFRKYPKDPPKAQDLVASLGPQYSGLIPVVRAHVPADYRMMLAHECRYHRRKFVHLSLMNDSHLLSLVIARKTGEESFQGSDLLPALVHSGIPMYRANVQRFQMAAFESGGYMVYFVSDLNEQQNTSLMLALAPQVRELLTKNAL